VPMPRDLLLKDHIQVEQLRASPIAVVQVLIPGAQPEEHCSNPVTTKQMPRLVKPYLLSQLVAHSAQTPQMVEARVYYSTNMRLNQRTLQDHGQQEMVT